MIFRRTGRPSSPPLVFTSLAHSSYPFLVAWPSAAKSPLSGSEMPTVIGLAELVLDVVLALVLPQAARARAVTALAAVSGTNLARWGRLIKLLLSCDRAEAPVVPRCAERTGTVCLYWPGKACFAPIPGPVARAAPRTALAC